MISSVHVQTKKKCMILLIVKRLRDESCRVNNPQPAPREADGQIHSHIC